MGLPVKKDNRVAVSRDSTEQAHELTTDMFGTPNEVREMAKMEREADTREKARSILMGLVNKPLKSKAGIAATISKKSIEKILSGKSADKSYDAKAHFLASANLEKLYSNAIEPFKAGIPKREGAGTLAPGVPFGSSVAPLSRFSAWIHPI